MKTYKTEIRRTPMGEREIHSIRCAGSNYSYDGWVEIDYSSNCGDIFDGICIGGVIFNKEDILEIAKLLRKMKQHKKKRRRKQ